MKKSFLKKKKVTGAFAIISVLAGYSFMNKGITGNAVINSETSINILSLIGLALIICSILLAYHTFKK